MNYYAQYYGTEDKFTDYDECKSYFTSLYNCVYHDDLPLCMTQVQCNLTSRQGYSNYQECYDTILPNWRWLIGDGGYYWCWCTDGTYYSKEVEPQIGTDYSIYGYYDYGTPQPRSGDNTEADTVSLDVVFGTPFVSDLSSTFRVNPYASDSNFGCLGSASDTFTVRGYQSSSSFEIS